MISTLKKIPPWLWVIAAFFTLNVMTLDWYTSVWMDEAIFVDPAANLYFGHGFTSSAWPTQPFGEFWAGNTPAYSLLTYLCFKAFGFGMIQVRVLDYMLWSGAVGLVCLAVQRLNLIRQPMLLAVVAILLFSGGGVVFNYRSGRYDSLTVFVAAACFWAFTIKQRGLRMTAIMVTASCFLPTALALGPFATVFGGLLFLFLGWKYFWELCCVAVGLAIGLCLLHWLYGEFGVWHKFWHAISYLSHSYYPPGQAAPIWLRKLTSFPGKLFHDPATMAVLVCLMGTIFFKWGKLDAHGRRLALLGISTFLVIPAVTQASYAYQIYYFWQAYIPMVVCLVGVLEHSDGFFKTIIWRTCFSTIILAIFAVGLGIRLGLAMTDLKERDYSKVESFIRDTVHPSDVVVADYQAFYPLHKLDVKTYYPYYFNVLTRQEADTINCLIIRAGSFPACKEKIGGEWFATGENYLNGDKFNIPLLNRLLPAYFTEQTNLKYNLMVYRRITPPSSSPPAK